MLISSVNNTYIPLLILLFRRRINRFLALTRQLNRNEIHRNHKRSLFFSSFDAIKFRGFNNYYYCNIVIEFLSHPTSRPVASRGKRLRRATYLSIFRTVDRVRNVISQPYVRAMMSELAENTVHYGFITITTRYCSLSIF